MQISRGFSLSGSRCFSLLTLSLVICGTSLLGAPAISYGNDASAHSNAVAAVTVDSSDPGAASQPGNTFEANKFGAKGDGVTDDTAAIQAAVDQAAKAGGSVHIGKGKYLVGSIELPSNITVYGDGAQTVLSLRPQPLRRTKQAPGHLFLPKDMVTVASVENVTIRDLALVGNSALQNGGKPMPLSGGLHGIAILGGKKWLVQRVRIEDFDGDGIYLGRNLNNSDAMAQGNVIENCVVRKNLRNGMMISHGDKNVLRNNLFEGNQVGMLCLPHPAQGSNVCGNPGSYPKFAPAVYGSAELDLEPNRIQTTGGVQKWEQVTNTVVDGNTFRDGNHLAIQIVKGAAEIAWTTISNNTFQDNRDGQILVFAQNAHDNVITHNKFIVDDPSLMSNIIRLKGGSNNRIIDNSFTGAIQPRSDAHTISIEPGPGIATVRCTEFSGNTLDFKSVTPTADVYVAKGVEDSVIGNNTFVNGSGALRVDGGKVLQRADQSRCGSNSGSQ